MNENDEDSDTVSLNSVITSLEDMTVWVTELKYELSTKGATAQGRKGQDEPDKSTEYDKPEEEWNSVTAVQKPRQPEDEYRSSRAAGTRYNQSFHG